MKTDEWYTWANGNPKAQAMLDAINANPIFPIVGVRASDGVPQPNKQKTEKWADSLVEFEGEIVGCPRPPAEDLDRFNIGQSVRDAMLAAHNPNIVKIEDLPPRVQS